MNIFQEMHFINYRIVVQIIIITKQDFLLLQENWIFAHKKLITIYLGSFKDLRNILLWISINNYSEFTAIIYTHCVLLDLKLAYLSDFSM